MSKTAFRFQPEFKRPSFSNRRLMDRDVKLLELLALYGCVSIERIKSELWNNKENLRSHYRRLGVLRNQGWIEKVEGDEKRIIGYRLSRSGKAFLSSILATSEPIEFNRRSYKTQFEHDQLMIDLRRLFTSSPVIKDFKTEAEVTREITKGVQKSFDWKKAPTIPDATFVLLLSDKTMRVAIELELSAKNKARYQRIFRNHLLTDRWSIVFYIVKDQKLLDHLREQLRHCKESDVQVRVSKQINGIYFGSLESVLRDGLKATFFNGKQEISLAEISQAQKSK